MPPANELKFRVLFVYSEDGFEQDPAKFWHKFGKKQNDKLESFLSKRKEMEAAVAQIVSPSDSPDAKLRKIYDRVQQFKNLSYESAKTVQELKRDKQKQVDNAADILKNGYGNGDQLTWLFVGLARAAGFDASGVLISSRNDYFFKENRMDSKELNSNVALVKLNGNELFFDPGSAFTPYGLLPWQETASRGLKLNKDGGTWVESPLPESSSSEIKRTANFKMIDDGSLEGKVIVTYTGLEAWSRRQNHRNQDDEDRKKYLEEHLKECIPAAIDVDLTKQPDWTSSELPLTAEFDVKIPGWTSSAGRHAIMATGIFSAAEKHLFEHSNRVNAVYFHYPYRVTDNITIELPSGWKVETVPKDQDNNAKAAQYIFKVDKKPGSIQVTRIIRSDLTLVPKDLYPTLRNFFQLVKSNDEQQVVLQPGSAAAQN